MILSWIGVSRMLWMSRMVTLNGDPSTNDDHLTISNNAVQRCSRLLHYGVPGENGVDGKAANDLDTYYRRRQVTVQIRMYQSSRIQLFEVRNPVFIVNSDSKIWILLLVRDFKYFS